MPPPLETIRTFLSDLIIAMLNTAWGLFLRIDSRPIHDPQKVPHEDALLIREGPVGFFVGKIPRKLY